MELSILLAQSLEVANFDYLVRFLAPSLQTMDTRERKERNLPLILPPTFEAQDPPSSRLISPKPLDNLMVIKPSSRSTRNGSDKSPLYLKQDTS